MWDKRSAIRVCKSERKHKRERHTWIGVIRERERESERGPQKCLYTHTHTHS